jgi:hypothetical protein
VTDKALHLSPPGAPRFLTEYFLQKVAKRRWIFSIKGKNGVCLEIWYGLTPVASFLFAIFC